MGRASRETEARLGRLETILRARHDHAAAPKLADHRHGLLVAGYLAEVEAVHNPADDRSQLAVLKAGCLLTGDRSCLAEIVRAEDGLVDDAFWSAVNLSRDLSRTAHNAVTLGTMNRAGSLDSDAQPSIRDNAQGWA